MTWIHMTTSSLKLSLFHDPDQLNYIISLLTVLETRVLVEDGCKTAETTKDNIQLPEQTNHTNTNTNNLAVDDNKCTVREQERFMPIANVIRIMRKILPSQVKMSENVKETIQECVSEYISFITGEENFADELRLDSPYLNFIDEFHLDLSVENETMILG
ncbi:hypothetical protein RJ640_002654 [Escallonia rubra]|uniref:Transcription factor CBF/NF-Y/archaeal histone domain-containing protein n=1 Tax=Escallonia rubra TaxID=112253 RepID=A0AA88QH45_9ASTE|nr:hypothetical protein RJ640_002654 [Escallonia rubra]